MANQIIVTDSGNVQVAVSPPANVQVQISRAVIGTVANVASANYANYANVANTALALDANIADVSISGGTNGYVLQTDGAGNLTWTAQTGGGGNASPGGSNTEVQFNDAGSFNGSANLTFNKTTGVLTAAKVAGNGAALTSITGANVTGSVANATYANSANTANSATVAASANSVAGANVTGQVSYAAVANSVAGANVSGTVANATYAVSAGSSNTATTAGTVTTNAQPNITSVGTLTSLAVTGNVSANAYQLTTSPGTLTAATGQMVWSASEQTMNLGMNNGVVQQVGLENYILIKASATITNGQVVMFTGANGDNVTGAPADTTSVGFRPEYIIGVATQDIANNATGYITVFGIVHGLNTNAYNVGDILWVDNTTPGGLTATRPSDPNYQIEIAAVTKKSGGDGHIQVRVTPFNDINSLTNVSITTPANGQALVYSGNVWVNGNPNQANYAAVANSVAVANVSGIGNIATVNLDGNVSNLLTGAGTFVAIPTGNGGGDANFANYAGNVTVSSQPNITSTGNLVSLQVGNSVANTVTTKFVPAGANITTLSGDVFVNNTRTSYDDADVLANGVSTQDAIVVPTDTTNASSQSYTINYLTQDLANPSNIATVFTDTFNVTGYDAGNAAGYGSRTLSFYTPSSDLANANPNTTTDFLIGDQSSSASAFFINQKMPTTAPSPAGVMGIMNYGYNSNQAQSTALYIQRRRGNNSGGTGTRDQVQANDYLGNISWRGAGATNGTVNSGTVSIAPKVDSSYGGPGNVMPIGMELVVVNSSNTQLTHSFYANGDVNISGNISATNLGNIASINLDGSSSNVLYGNGVWAAAGGGGDANFANYAGNVTVSSQGNITSLGNLVSLQVGNNAANITTTTFTPVGANITTLSGDIFVNNKRVSNDDADAIANNASTSDAIINPYDTGNGVSQSYVMNYLVQDLANPSNIATAGTDTFSIGTYDAGNMASTSDRTLALYTSDSDLANANPNTTLNFVHGGSGLFINRQMPNDLAAIAGAGLIGMMNYGEAGDPADATGILMQRRRGNNSGGTSTRDPVVADDYLGNIAWRGAGTATGTINSGRAVFGAKVDSSYGGPGNVMPIGMEMTVIDSSNAQLTHSFYANGDVSFAGNILSNAPPSSSIVNGNSSVSFTGAGGDLLINIDNTQFATFYNNRRLELSGVEADSANATQLVLDNGGIQLVQEDLGGGFASFDFKSYFSTGFIAPYTFYRARGNTASPAAVQSGDAITTQSYIVYGDSGNTFVNVGSYSATVTANDNAGNVQSRIEIATNRDDNGSEVKLNADVVTLQGNSLITLNADNSNVSGNLNVTGSINFGSLSPANLTVSDTTTSKIIRQDLGSSNLTPGNTLNLAADTEQYFKVTLTTYGNTQTSTINCANLDTSGYGKTYKFLVYNNSGQTQTVQAGGLAQVNPSTSLNNGNYGLLQVDLHGTDGSGVWLWSNLS